MRDLGAYASGEAADGGLIHLTDDTPGYQRRGEAGDFSYVNARGRRVRDARTLDRIHRLAIPPAWTNVWIAPRPQAHLQATGRDARGRKQYKYHAQYRDLQEARKFEHMLEFVAVLPKIRARVAADMRKPGLSRDKVLAAIVALLEATLIRVGNECYAQENGSFGLTTLQDRHALIDGATIRFIFKGKSGRLWRLKLRDRRIAKIVRAAQELPGQQLFQYEGEDGAPQRITSNDVNAYLKDASGRDVTAKDFRTWAGTVLASMALAALAPPQSAAAAKRNVRAAMEIVSQRLGNTPTICRKCYIHPIVFERYLAADLSLKPRNSSNGLSSEEAAVRAFLRRALRAAAPA